MSIQQNSSSMFTTGAPAIPNNGFLARFTVPGMPLLLWSRHQIQQKVVGYTHSIHATVAPMSISSYTSPNCSSQGSQLAETVNGPRPSAACLASQWLQHFLDSSKLTSPCLMSPALGSYCQVLVGYQEMIACIIWGFLGFLFTSSNNIYLLSVSRRISLFCFLFPLYISFLCGSMCNCVCAVGSQK